MKVRQEILEKINNPQVRTRIATSLNTGEANVYIHVRKNSKNGRLTRMDALQAISKETGIPVTEILESEPADA